MMNARDDVGVVEVGGLVYQCYVKQKTAYEMHISDWSSDVCSSDLEACPAWAAQKRGDRASRSRVQRRGSGRRVGAVFPDGRVLREATRPEAAIVRCHFEMAERNRHRKTIENFWKKGRKSAMSVNCKLIRQAREGASCAR